MCQWAPTTNFLRRILDRICSIPVDFCFNCFYYCFWEIIQFTIL